MAFRSVAVEQVDQGPVTPRPRNRAPILLDVLQPVLLTMVVNIDVGNPEKLYHIARIIMAARGATEAEINARLCPYSRVDMGECVKALMEESLSALAISTDAKIGPPDVWSEIPYSSAP